MRFPESGKTEWAKMVMCAEIKAISRRTPELPLSPGRMVTLDGPRNRQGGSCCPLITVLLPATQVSSTALAFGCVHWGPPLSLPFVSCKAIQESHWTVGRTSDSFLAGDGRGMGCRNVANDACRGKVGRRKGSKLIGSFVLWGKMEVMLHFITLVYLVNASLQFHS